MLNRYGTVRIPSYNWLFGEGFSDEEIIFLAEFLHHNAHLIFRSAEKQRVLNPLV